MKYGNAASAFQILGALVLSILSADGILDEICADNCIATSLCIGLLFFFLPLCI